MDYQAIVEEIRQRELATHTYSVRGDVEAARADTSPDLIHIAVDGHRWSSEKYFEMIADMRGAKIDPSLPELWK